MSDGIPSFFSQFHEAVPEGDISPDRGPAIAGTLMESIPNTSRHVGPSFTVKDWEMLRLIAAHNEGGDYEPSNSELGGGLGVANGAVSARVKRLVKMGLLVVEHFNATDTGKNNRRTMVVQSIPPKPWEPV